MGAIISPDGMYRYRLDRLLDHYSRCCVFIMLNPSTADATNNDPTIRRCLGFADSWEFRELIVVNLFAYRTPSPSDLVDAAEAGIDVIGPENDRYILDACLKANRIIAAWGSHGGYLNRDVHVKNLLYQHGLRAQHLGLTSKGKPRHPLYLKKDSPVEYLP